jgi:ABC-type uncharacterized transport system substrate-binding protein
MQFDQLKRREFITLLGGAAVAWPLAARAQQGARMRRIGVLSNVSESHSSGQRVVAAFRQGLQDLGWVEGQDVWVDVRWSAGDPARSRSYAAELVALAPDVILAVTTATVVALKQASQTIPIVFVGVIDPVGSGLIASLPRPGGNATGFTIYEYAISAKWLELLKEIAPRVTRAAVLRDATIAAGIGQFAAIQTVAPVGMELNAIDLREAGEVEHAVAAFAREPDGGLIVTASGFSTNHPHLLAAIRDTAQSACCLPFPLLCPNWWPNFLWA